MTETEPSSIKVFAEYLNNLRAVNLYVTLPIELFDGPPPKLFVNSGIITFPKLGSVKIVLQDLDIENCTDVGPRSLDKSTLCYRLLVKPAAGQGSAAAEIVQNFEKTVDEGARNLVKNSINKIALKEGEKYQISCRFCENTLSGIVSFDRIRPLPSRNWVENAHELWYCHPPEGSGLGQDVAVRLDKINLEQESIQSKSIVELLQNPDLNYLFYGPCNWALNKSIVEGVIRQGVKAECKKCSSELGSFTSESCVKIWDYGVRWSIEETKTDPKTRAFDSFKRIVFATIYELSDHPTFRFTLSSVEKGNSVFLWNIDRNLQIYEQTTVNPESHDTIPLEKRKVAKFFFAQTVNDELLVSDPREVVIVRESEENEESILTVPDFVYKVGVEKLKETGLVYSRSAQSLQCGYLVFEL